MPTISPTLYSLKKTLQNKYRKQGLRKIGHFIEGNTLEVEDWFMNAIFISLDLEWYSNPQYSEQLQQSMPPTELGFAVIRGKDLFDAVNSTSTIDLEVLFSKIRAWHIRVKENAHGVNRAEWLQVCAMLGR